MSLVISFRNKSNLAPISDYDYKVMVGDGSRLGSHIIEEGEVKGHRRSDGWKALVRRIVEETE